MQQSVPPVASACALDCFAWSHERTGKGPGIAAPAVIRVDERRMASPTPPFLSRVTWSCQLSGSFKPYDEDKSRVIEEAYQDDESTVRLTLRRPWSGVDSPTLHEHDAHGRQ